MSRHGRILPIADGTALNLVVCALIHDYSMGWRHWTSRSAWLAEVEDALRLAYPEASSADLTLTARHLAPFPLKAGHDVP